MSFVEDERIFLTLKFLKTTIQSYLWAFGFGGSYVCTTFLYSWYFSLQLCHHNMDRGKNMEGSFALKTWIVVVLWLVAWYVLCKCTIIFKKHHGCYYKLCWQFSNYNPWQLFSIISNLSLFELFICLSQFRTCILVLLCLLLWLFGCASLRKKLH
jgi:hypothetical protein